MNREELLKKLGLSAEELHELLRNFRIFLATLNQRQRRVIHRSLPTIADAQRILGTEVSQEDLLEFFENDQDEVATVVFHFARSGPSGDGGE